MPTLNSLIRLKLCLTKAEKLWQAKHPQSCTKAGKRGGLAIAYIFRPNSLINLSPRITLASVAVLIVAGCHSDFASVTPGTNSSPETAEYVIGPGDHLNVFVYDNPQLGVTDLPVRPDGRVSTPLVSDVPAAGKTPAELASALTERLKKYVKDPDVTVMVRDFIGPFDRQIRVIGEAADPQAIAYSEHMTVLDVMIRTKGLTRFAAGNKSVIIRTIPGRGTEQLRVRLSDLIKDGDISQNVEMQPGDTLIIPQTWF